MEINFSEKIFFFEKRSKMSGQKLFNGKLMFTSDLK